MHARRVCGILRGGACSRHPVETKLRPNPARQKCKVMRMGYHFLEQQDGSLELGAFLVCVGRGVAQVQLHARARCQSTFRALKTAVLL